MMQTHKRRRAAKGKWMKLIDPNILAAHMKHRDISQSRLARYVGCSRQFINQLLQDGPNGRSSCTPRLAEAIEEVLNVPQGALFVQQKSTDVVHVAPRVRSSGRSRAAA